MTQFILLVANVLTVMAGLPYVVAIIRGTTKPRVASWFGWGALTLVASAAALQQHQLPAATFLAVCSFQNFVIVILGLRHGDRHLTPLDLVTIMGALFGGSALVFIKSPVLSTWVAIITDIVALIPTLKHTWDHPAEETVATYIMEGIASVLILAIAGGFAFTAIAYPLYLLLSNEVLAVLIINANRRQQLGLLEATSTLGPISPPVPKPPFTP